MAIDDPVEIAIRQADEAITDESYLPKRLVMCGLSAALAAELAAMPAVSGIVLSLFKFGSVRFERRLLVVAEELNAQQKRIEASIPDRKYYESEEFQSLIGLVIEKLNTTHDEEKLRMFGDALANAGSSGYQPDEKEDYIRILRDLSNKDLQVLKHSRLNGGRFFHDAQSSVGRLVGMGLVTETLEEKRTPMIPRTADSRRKADALKELVTKPPKRAYSLSSFGLRFLDFIAKKERPSTVP
jgi:hypothetical protein